VRGKAKINTLCTDTQVIGETSAQAFAFIQQGPVNAAITLKNAGINTINYVFQELISGVWTNIDVLGTDVNNTLVSGQSRLIQVESDYPQVRCMANASGGSTLEFGVLRWVERADGGQLPILNF